MAHIPMDDIAELWRQTGQPNWTGLRRALQSHLGDPDGIIDSMVETMLRFSEQLERAGHPYPRTLEQLYEVFNQQLQMMRAR